MTAETPFVIRLGVKDAETAAAALRAFGKQGEEVLKKLENAAARQGRAAASAQRDQAGAMKLNAQQAANLSYQLNDIFVQLASGQSVFMTLAQQGPQITQIFGGLGNTLKAIPLRLVAIGGPLAVVGAAFALYEKHAASVRAVDRAVRLMGTGVAGSAAQVAALGEAHAEAGRLSQSAARSMAAEYVKAGKVGADALGPLIGLTRDFAVVTGQDAADAVKELAGYLRDPAKGAEELAGKFNLLSGAMLDHVRRLSEAGRTTEAQKALVDALGQRIKGAAEETSVWSRAWDAVARGASNAADAVGRALRRVAINAWREARTADDAAVVTAYGANNARVVDRETLITGRDDADAEALALRDDAKEPRQLFELPCTRLFPQLGRLDVVLVHDDLPGFENGKLLRIIGARIDQRAKATTFIVRE